MSDNKDEETFPKGNEWEVVAVTESVYAATSGPKQDALDSSHGNLIGDDDPETAGTMFMSGHFGFSPSKQENLTPGSEYKDKCSAEGHDSDVSQVPLHQGGKRDSKHVENMNVEGLTYDDFPRVPDFKEKGQSVVSLSSSEFGGVLSSNLMETEQSMHDNEKFGSSDDKSTPTNSYIGQEGAGTVESFESVDHSGNSGTSNVEKHIEEDNCKEPPKLPSEAWWRKHAASLYDHARSANPFWSSVVAAAFVGLVIIGHRWQRDKPCTFQLKSKLFIDEKGSGWIVGPITHLKDTTMGGQRSSYITLSSFAEI